MGIQPEDWIIGLAAFGGVTLMVTLYWRFGFTCPQCRTRRGLERKGGQRNPQGGRLFTPKDEERFRCRRCGHTLSRTIPGPGPWG